MEIKELKSMTEKFHTMAKQRRSLGAEGLVPEAYIISPDSSVKQAFNDATNQQEALTGYAKFSAIARNEKAVAVVLINDFVFTGLQNPNRQGTLQATIVSPSGCEEAKLTAEYRTEDGVIIFDRGVWDDCEEKKQSNYLLPWAKN